jgi:hypothetical protein
MDHSEVTAMGSRNRRGLAGGHMSGTGEGVAESVLGVKRRPIIQPGLDLTIE